MHLFTLGLRVITINEGVELNCELKDFKCLLTGRNDHSSTKRKQPGLRSLKQNPIHLEWLSLTGLMSLLANEEISSIKEGDMEKFS
jgi:hypothetical protein